MHGWAILYSHVTMVRVDACIVAIFVVYVRTCSCAVEPDEGATCHWNPYTGMKIARRRLADDSASVGRVAGCGTVEGAGGKDQAGGDGRQGADLGGGNHLGGG